MSFSGPGSSPALYSAFKCHVASFSYTLGNFSFFFFNVTEHHLGPLANPHTAKQIYWNWFMVKEIQQVFKN